MSQWTHVAGCVRLFMSPYVKSTNNEGEDIFTLKYPKEQCKIIKTRRYSEDEPTLVTMEISSLPLAKRIIKPLMKQIMPQGEESLTYFLNQEVGDYGSSYNYFNDDTERKIYEELCKKKFGNKYNDEDYELYSIQNNCNFNLTVSDNLRYCSGEELYEDFMKLFLALDKAGIYLIEGTFEWTEDWAGKLYRITKRFNGDDNIIFEIRDVHTDKVEKFDVLVYNDDDHLAKEKFLSFEELLEEEKD